MSTAAARQTSSADGIAWRLDDLYFGVDDAKISADLDKALERAQAFETRYRGRIDAPGGPKVDELLRAVTELEAIYEQMDKPAIYSNLVHAAKTDDPKRGALLSST